MGAAVHGRLPGRHPAISPAQCAAWLQRGLLLDPGNLSMRYNLACALVMELDDKEAALDALQPYFDLVMSPIHVKHLEADPDMNTLRDHPRFKEMLEQTRRRLSVSHPAT